MPANKRKKNSRQRGSWTHGWGEKKKHRGAGHRGGRGNAGSGKKADQKKPSYWKLERYYGKHGFKKKGIKVDIKAINLMTIEQNLNTWLTQKLITEKNKVYEIDLSKLGFNKVLGYGTITAKLNVKADYFSKNAEEKIIQAGGQCIKPEQKEEAAVEAEK